ncbi:unnamed protein product, partial [Nesidiocoris tenuis]
MSTVQRPPAAVCCLPSLVRCPPSPVRDPSAAVRCPPGHRPPRGFCSIQGDDYGENTGNSDSLCFAEVKGRTMERPLTVCNGDGGQIRPVYKNLIIFPLRKAESA